MKGQNLRIIPEGKNEGLVEVRINGTWGTICSQTINKAEATVICRQLNFTYGVQIRKTIDYHNTSFPVWIKGMYCIGNEDNIFDCQISGLGESNLNFPSCNSHIYDLAIKCYSNGRNSDILCIYKIHLSCEMIPIIFHKHPRT